MDWYPRSSSFRQSDWASFQALSTSSSSSSRKDSRNKKAWESSLWNQVAIIVDQPDQGGQVFQVHAQSQGPAQFPRPSSPSPPQH